MRFRLKEKATVNDPKVDWLKHGTVYEGDWAPGPRRDPPSVRLISPDGYRWAEISEQVLERLE